MVVIVVKNLPANAGDKKNLCFHPWVGKIPWRRAWQATPVFLPGESHGQKNLAGYSPCLVLGGDTQILYFPYNDHNLLLVTVGIFHKKGKK